MRFEIDQQVAQRIADYLSTRPFNEVAGHMTALTQLKEIPEPEAEPEAEPTKQ